MRFTTFLENGRPHLGVVDGDQVIGLPPNLSDLRASLEAGADLHAAARAAIASGAPRLALKGLSFAPLVPAMRLSCLIGVGRMEERAVVVDGQIVIRPILPLTATLDHRVIDGFQAGRLAHTLTQLLSDPEGAGL